MSLHSKTRPLAAPGDPAPCSIVCTNRPPRRFEHIACLFRRARGMRTQFSRGSRRPGGNLRRLYKSTPGCFEHIACRFRSARGIRTQFCTSDEAIPAEILGSRQTRESERGRIAAGDLEALAPCTLPHRYRACARARGGAWRRRIRRACAANWSISPGATIAAAIILTDGHGRTFQLRRDLEVTAEVVAAHTRYRAPARERTHGG